jgi:hypothetical protein
LDVWRKIDHLTGLKHLGALKMNCVTLMILTIIYGIKSRRSSRHTQILATLGSICCGSFILFKNRLIRALRDAGTAIDASVWVNIVPGPLLYRLPGYNALHRTNINTSGIAEAQTGDDMGHFLNLQ